MLLAIPFVLVAICTLLLVHGWMIHVTAQSGFVSIDCGGSNTNYKDAETQLSWTSDGKGFGLENVSRVANVNLPTKHSWLSSMRIFEGNQSKYCYEFNDKSHGIVPSNPYLVRASFWIGDMPPFSIPNEDHIHFRLLINADEWDSIVIYFPQKEPLVMELYVFAVLPSISVCVAKHEDIAFISSLELRPINKNFFLVSNFMQPKEHAGPPAFFLYTRVDLGGSRKDVRYPDDKFDRIWSQSDSQGLHLVDPTAYSVSTPRLFHTTYAEAPPSVVLQTALVDNSSFSITSNDFSRSYQFQYMVSFAEISDNATANQRVFYFEATNASGVVDQTSITLHGDENTVYYNQQLLPVDEGGFLTFNFRRNATSSLGPLVNALELLYSSPGPMSLGTYDDDVNALKLVKENLPRFDSWRGDPCLPFSYEWLTCDSEIRPRIIKLSLQNRNITGEIPMEIGSLKALVELNLQGNNFSGSIPESIAQIPNLTTLFLQDNNLGGTIPQALLDKGIDLRLAGNPILCMDNNATYCGPLEPLAVRNNRSKKSHTLLVAILAPSCAVVVVLLAFLFIFHFKRKSKNGDTVAITHAKVIKYSNLAQQFTSQQIERMTNGFKNKLGAGSFGDVFLGTLSTGMDVAVKVSSHRGRAQESSEFLNEVALLSRVHHKNLVEFVGYCIQSRLVLVYEYMGNGSLENYLHGKNTVFLSWKDRLKVVAGAALGLEYLHKGCKPPIIHRDVKCSNILLDEKLEGKISDFGISRLKLADTQMTVSNVQGTVGYIAPEYAELRITEKIDVFSFGVVLLIVVSGKRPYEGSQHIVDWIRPLVNQSQIENIVDPRIAADYNMSSIWKVLEVAMACVEQDAQRRPDMHEVSSELHSAWSFELQNDTGMPAYNTSDLSFNIEDVSAR